MLDTGYVLSRSGLQNIGLLHAKSYIDGEWTDGGARARMPVIDPFTGHEIASAPSLAREDVERSVDAAEAAFPSWATRPARERCMLLRRWHARIMEERDNLARLITLENGKPLKEALGEIDYGAGFIELYAEEGTRILGEIIPPNLPGRRLLVERYPVGVCAVITPWNFPIAMLTRKIAPALAAGCTVIAKPAPQTPLSAFALAALAEEAGIPPGVLNIVTGDAAMIGGVFTASPVIRKISFTGSTPVGAKLMAQSAPTIKRLSLELGGNAPLVVFDDADLDKALGAAMVAKFRNSGQSCIAANRIYVQRGIYEAFLDGFARKVSALKVGDGFAPETDIGPLISESAVAKVKAHFDDAMEGGATLLAGGEGFEGRFCPPTLMRDVRNDALLTREETFGPLAAVILFASEEDAIRLANDTPFGLAAYACTRNSALVAKMSRSVESGMLGVNTGLISTAVAPFGGVKQSGLGREGSRHGLDEYLSMKYICEAGL